MNTGERQERDEEVLRLFIAGHTYRAILRLTPSLRSVGGVHKIVQRELAAAAQRRLTLSDEAYAIYQERTEALLAAHMPVALDTAHAGTHKSALVAQRILAGQARLYELIESRALPAATRKLGSPAGDDDDESEADDSDELSRLRAKRSGG